MVPVLILLESVLEDLEDIGWTLSVGNGDDTETIHFTKKKVGPNYNYQSVSTDLANSLDNHPMDVVYEQKSKSKKMNKYKHFIKQESCRRSRGFFNRTDRCNWLWRFATMRKLSLLTTSYINQSTQRMPFFAPFPQVIVTLIEDFYLEPTLRYWN